MASRKNKTNSIIGFAVLAVIAVVITVFSSKFIDVPDEHEKDTAVVDYGSFSVHFIDVGQGDCTLIKSDSGNMLIDAGENGNESAVLNYLSEQGVDSLKYFVATHPHSDHIGGAQEVIKSITVENIIMPKLSASNTPTTKTYENMLLAIQSSGAKVIAAVPGKEYAFGKVNFTVLSPFEQDNNLNNMSVAIRLTYGEYSFMFTGDAEKEVEKQLVESGFDLTADVYKAAHHGSSTSNTEEFIAAVDPEYAVISCGAGNSYGHPHDEVIELFDDYAIKYYSTENCGDIVFTVAENGLTMFTEN